MANRNISIDEGDGTTSSVEVDITPSTVAETPVASTGLPDFGDPSPQVTVEEDSGVSSIGFADEGNDTSLVADAPDDEGPLPATRLQRDIEAAEERDLALAAESEIAREEFVPEEPETGDVPSIEAEERRFAARAAEEAEAAEDEVSDTSFQAAIDRTIAQQTQDEGVSTLADRFPFITAGVMTPEAVAAIAQLRDEDPDLAVEVIRQMLANGEEEAAPVPVDLPPEFSRAARNVGLSDSAALSLIGLPTSKLTPALVESKRKFQAAYAKASIDPSAIQIKVADALTEALTFGKVETETFNRDDLNREYDKTAEKMGVIFDDESAKLQAQGLEIADTKEKWIEDALGSKEEYADAVIDAMPTLGAVAKEVGLASIPVYGTMRTWEDNPGWANALSVTADVLFVVPFLGQMAAAARAGGGLGRTAGRLVVSEITAPVTALRHPIRTIKGVLEPIETLLDTRKIPVEALEVRRSTIRLQGTEEAGFAREHVGIINTPEDLLPSIRIHDLADPKTADFLRLRDELTKKSYMGQRPTAVWEGTEFQIASPAAQRVTGPGVFMNSPDIRNLYHGTTVGELPPSVSPQQGAGPMYFAPSRMERFVQATSTGLTELPLSAKSERAVALGKMSNKPIKGSVWIRDPELLAKLQNSGKFYKGSAEIETILPVGTKIPPPSQVLFTRSAETGEKTMILIIGPKISRAEIAKMKLLSFGESINQILKPGKFGQATVLTKSAVADGLPVNPTATKLGVGDLELADTRIISSITDAGIVDAQKAANLYEQAIEARRIDDIPGAVDFERRADILMAQAEVRMAGAAASVANSNLSYENIYAYAGDGDIEGALRELRPMKERAAPVTPEDEIPELPRAPRDEAPRDTRPVDSGVARLDDVDDVDLPRVTDDAEVRGEAPERPRRVDDEEELPVVPERPRVEREDERVEARLEEPPPPRDERRDERRDDDLPRRDDPLRLEDERIPPDPGVVEPRIPAEPRRPARGRLIKLGSEVVKPEVLQGRTPGYSWKQGEIWVGIYPPFGPDDIAHAVSQPPNTKKTRGPRQAWKAINTDGFEIDADTFDDWAAWFRAGGGTEISVDIKAPKIRRPGLPRLRDPGVRLEGVEAIPLFIDELDDWYNPGPGVF